MQQTWSGAEERVKRLNRTVLQKINSAKSPRRFLLSSLLSPAAGEALHENGEEEEKKRGPREYSSRLYLN